MAEAFVGDQRRAILMPTAREIYDGYRLIEQAAIAGARCPVNITMATPDGGLASGVTGALARDGRIRIEVYAKNWRVIEILKGPHAGKRTAPPPFKGSRKPYKIITTETVTDTQVTRRIAERAP